MDYFFYCRDKPGTGALRKQLVETHWSFMDGYASRMSARGPTVQEDGVTQTGSTHIVDLPDADAARVFACEEPYYKAGVFAEVIVRRWENELGRTMWDFKGQPEQNRRFLIIAHGRPGMDAERDRLAEARRCYYAEAGYRDRLIASGPLLSEDGRHWLGSAIMVELPDRAAAEALLKDDPFTQAGLYEKVEMHYWRFGGRR